MASNHLQLLHHILLSDFLHLTHVVIILSKYPDIILCLEDEASRDTLTTFLQIMNRLNFDDVCKVPAEFKCVFFLI